MTAITSSYLLNSPFLAEVDPVKGVIGPKYSEMLAEEMAAPMEEEQEKAARQGTLPVTTPNFMTPANFMGTLSPEAQMTMLAIQEAQSAPPETGSGATPVTAEEQAAAAQAEHDAVVSEFIDYMEKTPEERYFEAILKELGLTPEEFAALPPDEKAKVQLKVMEKMQEDIETNTSKNNDETA